MPLKSFRDGSACAEFAAVVEAGGDYRGWLVRSGLMVIWHPDGSFDLAFAATARATGGAS